MDDDILASDREAHRKFYDPKYPLMAPALCEGWQQMPVDPIEDEPVVSDIPTLLLSGQFDPITPPRWADLAAETLSNSYSFVLPMTGHGVGIGTPCGRTLMRKFLESPTTNPVSPCTVGSETGFSDMYLNRGPRTMGSWHFDSVNPPIPETLELWMNLGHIFVTLSVLIVWPLLFLHGLLRRGRRSVLSRAWLARLIAAATLFATLGFTRWVLNNGGITDDLVQNFGYYSSARPWFIVPYIVWAATALVLYLTYRHGERDGGRSSAGCTTPSHCLPWPGGSNDSSAGTSSASRPDKELSGGCPVDGVDVVGEMFAGPIPDPLRVGHYVWWQRLAVSGIALEMMERFGRNVDYYI